MGKKRKPRKNKLDRFNEWKASLKDPTRPTLNEIIKGLNLIMRGFADTEKLIAILSDPKLTAALRLAEWKKLDSWPRTVFGIYEFELEKAQSRPEKGAVLEGERYGGIMPSQAAYAAIAEVIGVGEDWVQALCNAARRELADGKPLGLKRQPRMSAADFQKTLNNPESAEYAALVKEYLQEQRRNTVVEFVSNYYKG